MDWDTCPRPAQETGGLWCLPQVYTRTGSIHWEVGEKQPMARVYFLTFVSHLPLRKYSRSEVQKACFLLFKVSEFEAMRS